MDEYAENINPNSGKFILNDLKRWGSEINQTHEFTFWLYFAEQELAKKAGQNCIPEVLPWASARGFKITDQIGFSH